IYEKQAILKPLIEPDSAMYVKKHEKKAPPVGLEPKWRWRYLPLKAALTSPTFSLFLRPFNLEA
ncbi:MAG: hypothetical protein QXF61_09440, partial [Nitrososphaeria archaeon]